MNAEENPMGKVVARALQDEAFKQQLIDDPAAVLAAEGVAVPDGVTLRVVVDTAEVRHLVLPAAGEGELSESELEQIAAGGWGCFGNDCGLAYDACLATQQG